MGAENAAEFVELGAKIAEVCLKLKALREQRDELNKQIGELEKELAPLLVKHAKFIAEMAGAALPPPPPVPQGVYPSAPGAVSNDSAPDERRLLEHRIVKFLEQAEPGIGAMDIANALNIRPEKVREVLNHMATRATQSAQLPIEPDKK